MPNRSKFILPFKNRSLFLPPRIEVYSSLEGSKFIPPSKDRSLFLPPKLNHVVLPDSLTASTTSHQHGKEAPALPFPHFGVKTMKFSKRTNVVYRIKEMNMTISEKYISCSFPHVKQAWKDGASLVFIPLLAN